MYAGSFFMKRTLLSLFLSLCAAALVSFLFVCLASLLLWKLGLSSRQMLPVVFAGYGLSCLVCGFFCARRQASRRILWGLLSGLLCFAVLLRISAAMIHQMPKLSVRFFLTGGICLAGGFLGALIS